LSLAEVESNGYLTLFLANSGGAPCAGAFTKKVRKRNKAEGTMNMMTDELDDAANPNARQVWIAALWAALVMASAGTVLLDGYEALGEPTALRQASVLPADSNAGSANPMRLRLWRGAMAPVLLTPFGSPIWTGLGHARPEIAVSSMPDKPSWVADTDGPNEPYHVYHSAVNRQNYDAKTTDSQWSFARPICCH
jgi:hypothetical protein